MDFAGTTDCYIMKKDGYFLKNLVADRYLKSLVGT